MIVYLNGRFLRAERARISPFDEGFLYGYGLFETLRVYGGRPFALELHLDRLRAAQRAIGLTQAPGPEHLRRAVHGVIARNALCDAYVRITLARGRGEEPTVFVFGRPFDGYPRRFYKDGMTAVTAPHPRSRNLLTELKSLSFLANVQAREHARGKGCDEAIFLTTGGLVTEGSVSNIFSVRDGKIIAPRFEEGALAGITAGIVLDLAQELGISVSKSRIGIEDLQAGDEAFMTNSLLEVAPLVRIDGTAVAGGRPGGMVRKIGSAYRARVAKELGIRAAEL